MPINADKPHLWKADTRASVDQFNQWFMKFAPKAYRDTRKKTIESVEQGLALTKDLTTITPESSRPIPAFCRPCACLHARRLHVTGLLDLLIPARISSVRSKKASSLRIWQWMSWSTSQENHGNSVADAGRGYFSVDRREAQTHARKNATALPPSSPTGCAVPLRNPS